MITGGMGQTATCGHEAREEGTTMLAFDVMEQEHMAFLYALYTRSAGDLSIRQIATVTGLSRSRIH
jgi:hypothetical protein